MDNNFNKILDECIDRINKGDTLEQCLADNAEFAQQLEPLLRVIFQARESYPFTPSIDAKEKARQRFNTALEKLEQKHFEKESLFSRLFNRPAIWATVTVVIVLVIAAYIVFKPSLLPSEQPPGYIENHVTEEPVSDITPVPHPEGNFIFLISDDVNAIEDFSSVNISISKIGIQLAGDSDEWIEFEPEVREVDLTQVKGEKTQQIWRGNINANQYNNVFIYVDKVSGVLKDTEKETDIKLPSNKIHISKPFSIGENEIVSFTFDITVIKAGGSGQYILKPQIDESGAKSQSANDNNNETQSKPLDINDIKDKNKGKKQNTE
jgi:hypothetical protein